MWHAPALLKNGNRLWRGSETDVETYRHEEVDQTWERIFHLQGFLFPGSASSGGCYTDSFGLMLGPLDHHQMHKFSTTAS